MSAWKMFNPPAPHPFSMSASNDEWVLITGVGGHHPDDSIAEDPEAQVKDALEAVRSLLEQAGSSVEEIVWFKPYVTSRELLPVVDAALRDFVGSPAPACGAMTITELADPRMVVEFEAWAHRGATRESSL